MLYRALHTHMTSLQNQEIIKKKNYYYYYFLRKYFMYVKYFQCTRNRKYITEIGQLAN